MMGRSRRRARDAAEHARLTAPLPPPDLHLGGPAPIPADVARQMIRELSAERALNLMLANARAGRTPLS
ncbi:MAG: hypothetical protein M3P23_05555 [Actinomycetota bacterium]|nr:hypothetical protein [Actinomycetota bacterium]